MIVLHYIPSIDRVAGGTSFYMQSVAAELGRMAEVHIVTHPSPEPLEMARAEVHYIATFMRCGHVRRQFISLLSKLRPDVVHVNGCWYPGCALVQRWAQKMGCKVALTPHGMLEPWIVGRHYLTRKLPALWLYQRQAVRRADCLHATAESERRNLLALGYNRRVEVIPNGVDVGRIGIKADWRRRKQILFLSRVHPKKGVELLIDAVAELREALDGYRVVIAGEGEASYVEQLKGRVRKAGVTSLVEFRGGVYGGAKWELYRQSDVFVLPTYSENFGIAVAEALACGTPVITTTGTPWHELAECGCGWWVEAGCRPLAGALADFLSLEDRQLESMGRRGRQLVEERYSSRRMAESLVDFYAKLIEA